MPEPKDAYREGYAKGKASTAGGALAEMTMGMLRDDPGGYFAAGYRDGAAGKQFNPGDDIRKGDDVRRGDADITPFDDKVAIKTACPNCRELDWFEWKFLGRLTDPVCGHTWYAGSGTYALMQLRAAFQFGGRLAKYMTSGTSRSSASAGEAAVGSLARGMFWILGGLLGVGIRLEFGVLMIPIQAVAGLFQPKKTNAEITARVVALAVTLGGLGLGFYELQHASQPQFQQVQLPQHQQAGVSSPPQPLSPSVSPQTDLSPQVSQLATPATAETVASPAPPPAPVPPVRWDQWQVTLSGCTYQSVPVNSNDAPYMSVCRYTIAAMESPSSVTACGGSVTL